ncbi:MAG: Gfo/Idh/MocA family oxidoreductase [Pseudomonadota bacterium]
MKRPANAALIGLGMVADMHAQAIAGSQGRVQLRGVLSRRVEAAQQFQAKHDVPRAYVDLDALLADDGLDFAIVATPPDARTEFLGALAARGLPVLCEKPLERDLPRATALVQTFDRAALPFGAVLQHRMRPAAITLKERIARGELGDITTVEVRVPWWRDQSYYDAPGRGTYARDGGGVLITQAIHTLDLMMDLVGDVAEVQAITASSRLHRLEAEDFAAAALRFASGATGSLMASTTHFPGAAESITLNGTTASAALTADSLTIYHRDGRVDSDGAAGGSGGGADPMAFSNDWHRAVIEDFARAVLTGRPPAIPARSALRVHALIDAMAASARKGLRIQPEAPHD